MCSPFICFSDKPPQTLRMKGGKASQYETLIGWQNNPNEFVTSLADAPMKEPACCCLTGIFAFTCLPSLYFRNQVLKTFGNGIDDYACCQGYLGRCCGLTDASRGSAVCMFMESCCFPVMSLSISRMYIMDVKLIHPDPMDYQIIQFSNFMQLFACICYLGQVCGVPEECAQIIGLIADIVTCSVSGCMGAQAHAELKKAVADGFTPGSEAAPGAATMYRSNETAVAPSSTVPVATAQRVVQVTVPQGCFSGMSFAAMTPDGHQVQITVPPGMGPGMVLAVQY